MQSELRIWRQVKRFMILQFMGSELQVCPDRQNDGRESVAKAPHSTRGVETDNVRALPGDLFCNGDAFGRLKLGGDGGHGSIVAQSKRSWGGGINCHDMYHGYFIIATHVSY